MPRTREITIKNWVIQASIGIFPREKAVPQRLRLSITLHEADARPVGRVEDVVNYAEVRERVLKLVTAKHTDLLEELVEHITSLLLQDTRLASVTVEAEKLDIFEDCESCGVKLTATR